ncbi:MarR family transcriptional regulator [Lachnotalea glycerini]|uniref:MarR family transcriptional regulator n=1 Tax=Lachnotalea glycerini TaxID=1763509 RepID=A0A255I3R2_9FIRM|nr:helix-turn-helix domain-containing protein [Lachnotalea glycerini]PXV89045.1 MarR family transcriptional regulator [Lachnotalea glycerini]RDY31516.1 MarR family transcriptional regulator [Lachnotalea glycerini]
MKIKSIGKSIIDLSYLLKRDMDQAIAGHGLTRMQAVILKFLDNESGKRDIFQKDIEKEFRIRKSSVTSVLQLLEKNGYIERESMKEDARFKKIVLTEKARQVNKMIGNGLEKREIRFQQVLTKDELVNFFQIMDKISGVVEES